MEAVSLAEAVKNKYGWQEEGAGEDNGDKVQTHRTVREIALSHRPGSRPIASLECIVISKMGVECAGDVEGLCPRVRELHLSYNSISHAKEIEKILSGTPSLKFLDLSYNPLNSSSFQLNGHSSVSLSTLVLNATGISWEGLEVILTGLQRLQELHLSINEYESVGLSPDFKHSTIQLLHINDNRITAWEELVKLSSAFPNLHTLIACSNPIQSIPEIPPDAFPSLHTLNLNSSALADWSSVEHLHAPPKLTSVSLLDVPVGAELKDKVRRQAFIARLPKIEKLNKSQVGETEREKAERWLIRDLKTQPNPPKLYQQLVEKHGELDALADVNLSKPKFVHVKFEFNGMDRESEEKEISVDQTVGELKEWIGTNLVGVPPSNIRLWFGMLQLKDSKKLLYTLRLHDGDVLRVEMK